VRSGRKKIALSDDAQPMHVRSTTFPQARRGGSWYAESTLMLLGRLVRSGRAMRAGAAAAVLFLGSWHASAADAVLYRIFLREGGSVTSYGDYARVGESVVFSAPVGGSDDEPALQLVTIPESAVDWDRTDRYAAAARAKRYADTRGETEFAQLSQDVTDALSKVSFTKDPAERLRIADGARRKLAEWPMRSYGYRAKDVAQLASVLDEVVSELRVAAGESRFDLTLVGGTVLPPPADELLPTPTDQERMEHALAVARLVTNPTERLALLRTLYRSLTSGEVSGPWVPAMRSAVSRDLARELRVERAYGRLVTRTLAAADNHVRQGNVRGVETLLHSVLQADNELGRARPGTITSLLATLDARVEKARQARLTLDGWELRRGAIVAYRRSVSGPLATLARLRSWLQDVRELAGPSPAQLDRLEQRAALAQRQIAEFHPPSDLQGPHDLLIAASRMAALAATTRRRAIASGVMPTAWEASSAAAGALMMLDRAVEELETLSKRPQIK
jgi:hypothetical protein